MQNYVFVQLLGICPFYTDVVSSSVYVLRTISCLPLLGTEESNFQEWSGCFCRTAVHAYCTWFTNVIFGNTTVTISRSPVFTFKWLVPCGHSLGWETYKGPLPIHNKDAILWMARNFEVLEHLLQNMLIGVTLSKSCCQHVGKRIDSHCGSF